MPPQCSIQVSKNAAVSARVHRRSKLYQSKVQLSPFHISHTSESYFKITWFWNPPPPPQKGFDCICDSVHKRAWACVLYCDPSCKVDPSPTDMHAQFWCCTEMKNTHKQTEKINTTSFILFVHPLLTHKHTHTNTSTSTKMNDRKESCFDKCWPGYSCRLNQPINCMIVF